jgi:FxsC-like protein
MMAQLGRMPDQDQHFLYFVSYARRDFYVTKSSGVDEAEEYLKKFFADLREAVRSKTGWPPDAIAFHDVEQLDVGKPWRPAVLAGLQTSRTLLALFTPTFFGRPECGVEVGFMQRRRRHHHPDDNAAPHGYVIPVIWERPAQIPTALKAINYFNDDFPAAYKQYGLRTLARQHKFADEYEQSVQAIAHQIDKVRLLDPPLPPLPSPPDPAGLPNVFAPANVAAPGIAKAAPIKGPNSVRFAYVAAADQELGDKGHRAPYGSRSEEWRPSPTDDRVVGMLAPYVAITSRFIPHQLTLDGSLQDQIAKARQDNALVVLLVDVWSVCFLQKYREHVTRYDSSSSFHCAALVVWNEQDADLTARQQQLETLLQHAVFPVNHSRALPYFHKAIRSAAELEASLRDTLERLQADVVTKAEAFRALEALDFGTRPAISNVPTPASGGAPPPRAPVEP